MTANSIVWVTGAGFSKSLGAPLLGDLFSFESKRDLEIRYPSAKYERLHGPMTEMVYALFHYGCAFQRGRPKHFDKAMLGERLWSDAEQFLDYLDAASREDSVGHSKARLNEIIQSFPGGTAFLEQGAGTHLLSVATSARRVLAAECSGFLLGQTATMERWGPYQRWARSIVTGDDVIITFNYDLLPELLDSDPKTRFMKVLVPGNQPMPTVAPYLKLHGSVNWLNNGTTIVAGDPDTALKCNGTEMVIAAPGPSKVECARTIKQLWEQAETALAKATAIVFLGYRFPPTDAEARTRLLEAIGRNTTHGLVVRTVLGDDTRSAARLEALVDYSLRTRANAGSMRYTVAKEPMFVEDFLSVCSRQAIFER